MTNFFRRVFYDNATNDVLFYYKTESDVEFEPHTVEYDVAHEDALRDFKIDDSNLGYLDWTEPDEWVEANFADCASVVVIDEEPFLLFYPNPKHGRDTYALVADYVMDVIEGKDPDVPDEEDEEESDE